MSRFHACLNIVALLLLFGCDRPEEPAYQLDLESLQKTDPSRVTFRQTGLIKLPFTDALGIAVLQHPLRFAVATPQTIIVINDQGTISAEQTLPVNISSFCATQDSQLFVAAGNQIFKGHSAGLKQWVDLPKEAFVCSLAFADGYLWAADSNLGMVYILNADGQITATIGGPQNTGAFAGKTGSDRPGRENVTSSLSSSGPGEERNGNVTPSPHFILPSRYFDLYPAPDGTVWVTNPGRHRLENYRSDGSLVSSWGQVGMQLERFAGCCNPAHIAVFPNARFATAEKGLIRIKEYDQQGQFAGLICGREKLKNDGSGLDLVSLTNDSLAVLDPEAGVIRIFERKPKIGTRASESFR